MTKNELDKRIAQLDEEFFLLDMRAPIEQYIEGPTCSICDALGHGYPGGGPCPLESPESDYYAAELAAGR